MFGASKTAFGASATSAFGQGGTLFGSTTTQPSTSNLFGQPTMNLGVGSPSFGAAGQTGTVGWGASADVSQASNGTSLAFNPPITTDSIQRGGQSTQVNAKHMCITAMKEYQYKSLEELRLEDYALNRQKGSGIGIAGAASIFGGSSAVKSFQFGGAQPTTNTTSIFGQANKPANTLFGGSNLMFGSSTGATSAFGQATQTQAGSMFGAKPLFGGTSTTGTGLFGSPQQASTGFTFGQTQPANALGGTSTNLFGQSTLTSTAAKPLFGSQPTTGSVMPFGQTQGIGLFGAAKTTATPSLFGAPTASLGTNPAQTSSFSFGSALKPGGTNLFGTATAATSNTLKPGGIFGTPASTGTTFGFGTGLSNTQTPTFGGFGTGSVSSTGGLFGQSANNSLTTKKTFGFGTGLTNPVASSSGTPSLFGFGQPAQTGGLFGTGGGVAATSTTPAFGLGGQSTSLFGTGSTGFGVGQKPFTLGGTTGFNTGTSGFGLGATGTGLGGVGTGLNTGLGTGLFGVGGATSLGTATSTTSSFGVGLSALGTQPGSLGGSLTGLGTNSAEQAAQAVRAQQQVLELVRSMPYGQSLFRYLNSASNESGPDENKNVSGGTNNASTGSTGHGGNMGVVPAKVVANALAERHKAVGLTVGSNSPIQGGTGASGMNRNLWLRRPAVTQRLLQISNRNKLFSGFYEDDALLSPIGLNTTASRVRRSATLNTDATGLDTSGLNLKLTSGGTGTPNGGFFVRRDEWKRLHLPESIRTSILERSASSVNEAFSTVSTPDASQSALIKDTPALHLPSTEPEPGSIQTSKSGDLKDSTVLDDLDTTWLSPKTGTDKNSFLTNGSDKAAADKQLNRVSSLTSLSDQSLSSPGKSPGPAGIKLSKHGYYTLPTLDELTSMVDKDGRCIVEDFVIGRRHYGHIHFPGLTDLTDIDLDAVVHIRRREVVVYPDDENKPPIGFGLNKRAEVCLESIWPTDKATHEPIKSPERLAVMRFEERLERATRRMDARFIEYRPESGSWVFEVKHFSKYGLQDSDEENPTDQCGRTVPPVHRASDEQLRVSKREADQSSCQGKEQKESKEKTAIHIDTDHGTLVQSLLKPDFSDKQPLSSLDRSINFLSPTTARCQSIDDDSPKKESANRAMFSKNAPATMFGTAERLSVSQNMVRQMRRAFFSPAHRQRSGARFGVQADGDEEDDYTEDVDHEVDGHNMKGRMVPESHPARWVSGKRFPSSPIPSYENEGLHGSKLESEFGVVLDSDRGEFFTRTTGSAGFTTLWTSERRSTGPTPEKFPRIQAGKNSFTSKLEEHTPDSQFDLSDEEAQKGYPNDIMEQSHVLPRTPFRPIVYEEPCIGVPLTPGHQHSPPVSSRLSLVRFPTQLKQIQYTNASLTTFLEQAMRCSEEVHRVVLSHCHLDASLWHGCNMKPSWGMFRDDELHTMALVTASYRGSGFSVNLSMAPTTIDLIDEALLNAALRTSARANESGQGTSGIRPISHTSLLRPSTDHCPLWEPVIGLGPLESYAQVLRCDSPETLVTASPAKSQVTDTRVIGMRRIIALCLALWGRHPQETTAAYIEQENHLLLDDADNVNKPESSQCYPRSDPAFCLPCDTTPFDRPQGAEHRPYPAAMCSLARKQAVSEWIRNQSLPWLHARLCHLNLWHVAAPQTNAADPTGKMEAVYPVPQLQVSTETVGQGIFACLVSGEPGAACRLALAASMPGLASVIAQCTAGEIVVRRSLQCQLRMWHEMKYDQHIPLIVLRIYNLLAGRTEFPHPKSATALTVLANLDWIRALGAYIWYLTDYALDLAGVLSAYSRAWHTNDFRSDQALSRPVPPEDYDLDPYSPPAVPSLPTDFPGGSNADTQKCCIEERSWPRDTAYHLLQLFCKRTHRLERTLDPCGIRRRSANASGSATCRANSNNLTDWTLSWMLWRVLITLGYRHFESKQTESRLCAEFAAQLETVGLWEWAVFVWLHEPDQTSRDAAVKSILARHVSLVPPHGLLNLTASYQCGENFADAFLLDEANELLDNLTLSPPPRLTKAEKFVVNKLGVPLRWVHEAKAVLARSRFVAYNRPIERSHLGSRISVHSQQLALSARLFALLEASHWLAAGHTEAAHSVCVDYLLPNMVLHADTAATLTTDPGPSWAMCRLGRRLARLLQPFDGLPSSKLPVRFSHGVGLYMMYSDILCLAEQLAQLCRTSAITDPKIRNYSTESQPMTDVDGEEIPGTETVVHSQLASTLSSLRAQLSSFAEQVQHMLTPNVNTKVVRTEMATICAHVISAFLIACVTSCDDQSIGGDSGLLDELQQQLLAMAKVGLPADYHLREQSNLAEARLSIETV